MSHSTSFAVFLHCRPGFEGECAAEIQDRVAALGVSGYCRAENSSGYVVFHPHQAGDSDLVLERLPFADLVFVRQWFAVTALLKQLPRDDRVAPIVASFEGASQVAGEIVLETPDTNEGKQLSALCRGIEKPLGVALRKGGVLAQAAGARERVLHLCFIATDTAYLGYSLTSNGSPWLMGIPRLRFPRGAPSRSTLKLEEALVFFLPPQERDAVLQPGMKAVDLGASPGGWTWQLTRRSLRVFAVDNGPMDQGLMDSGLVEHVRDDGFRYRPQTPVDWMVCDIVEQPIRVAGLVARWLEQRWCRQSIFNLKLPMKKRYQELQRCRDLIAEQLAAQGITFQLRCKQLYHDREEVTCYIERRGS